MIDGTVKLVPRGAVFSSTISGRLTAGRLRARWHAKLPAAVGDHEIDDLWSGLFGGTNKSPSFSRSSASITMMISPGRWLRRPPQWLKGGVTPQIPQIPTGRVSFRHPRRNRNRYLSL